ncbi:MAG: sigma-54-dependent Fis family transcriptional regulator [Deltaproteobacteria bacterium]|nr:sigma-54-dependent Fis family transcriptional regulator [Deltaproteobacteria bacterium]
MVKYIYNILVVDDDAGIRDVLKEFLEKKGYDIETIGDSRNVIERVKSKQFDIILVDLKMPDINGLELLKAIKQFDAETVVIIMTGYASLETAIQAIREGEYDYITKPFRLEEIYITIKNACEKIFLKQQHRVFIDELRQARESANKISGNTKNEDAEILSITDLLSHGMITKEEYEILKKIHTRVKDYGLTG